jgi:leader peptidase (prepilin peptidase)/N-methyltransferase
MPWDALSAPAVAAALAFAAGMGLASSRIAGRLAPEAAPPSAVLMSALAMAMAAAWLAAPAPAGVLLGAALLVLAAVDLAAMRLPDAVTLPAIVAGLAVAALSLGGPRPAPAFSPGELLSHAAGAAAGYLALAGLAWLFRRLRGREGLGLGDAKLAAVGGAWLGWRPLPAVILIACAAAFAWAALRALRDGRASLARPLPFGPPLALAIWIGWTLPAALTLE